MKQQVTTLKIELERLQTALSNERSKGEKLLTSKDERILELEKDRRFLYDSEAELRRLLEESQKRHQNELSNLKGQIQEERRKATESTERLLDCEGERTKLNKDLRTLKNEVEKVKGALRGEVESLCMQNTIKDQQIHSKDQVIIELQKQLLPVQKPSRISEPSIIVDGGANLEAIHKLEVINRRLTRENEVLRESTLNFKVMEEMLHTAQRRLEQYRLLEEKYNQLETKLRTTEQSSNLSTDSMAGREMRELIEKTAALAQLQDRFGELEAKYKSIMMDSEKSQERVASMTEELSTVKAEHSSLQTELLTHKQHESVLRAEIEILKEHLDAAERMEKASQSVILNLQQKLSDEQ